MDIVLIILGLLIAWLLIRYRIRKIKARKAAVPANFERLLLQHVRYYRRLDKEQQARFAQQARVFLENTHIEGVGLTVEDLDRVLVAAGAVIPVFGYGGWRYRNLTNVILYPDTFDDEYQYEGNRRNIMGMVGSGPLNGLFRSQIILSVAC